MTNEQLLIEHIKTTGCMDIFEYLQYLSMIRKK